MKLKVSQPHVVVQDVKAAADFYCKTLGYHVVQEHKGRESGQMIYMLLFTPDDKQSLGLEAAQNLKPAVAEHIHAPCAYLYHNVEGLDVEAIRAQPGTKVLVEPRPGPHGQTQVWALDPAGTVHCFAQWDAPPPCQAEFTV